MMSDPLSPINQSINQSANDDNAVTLPAQIIYSVSQKIPHLKFSDIFPKRLGIFSPNFTRLLYVPIYAGLQILIQVTATLTKLCHIKRDRHNVLKMSTIDRNARWVVALNMA